MGDRLGVGGEGSVFSVPGGERVAKIYHHALPAAKLTKLLSMVSCGNAALRGMSAWPLGLLHLGRHGPVQGFLMPRLVDYQAVHTLYGPAQRKAMHPSLDWAFLVQVARNMAAAFDTIHANGHVIGDVNQGNVFVAANALVKLIDCDSFQISAANGPFLCDVGVPHFIPPELQRVGSLRGAERSAHHDNFGLAVLAFHLLLMGRHPFAGIYAGGGDMPIERAIRESRYAFGHDSASTRMSRPPGSVGPEILTPQLAELFEQALCMTTERPPARRWVQALDELRDAIRTCGAEPMHRYYGKLPACPWCALEQHQGLVFFIGTVAAALPRVASFDLQAAWDAIEAARNALPALPVVPAAINVAGAPVPAATRGRMLVSASLLLLIVATALVLAAVAPRLLLLWALLGVLFWRTEAAARGLAAERARRRSALQVAQLRWHEVEQRWRSLSGEEQQGRKLQELAAARREYQQSEANFTRERQRLHEEGRARQLQRFLARAYITTMPELTAAQLATLQTHGIATAADVDWMSVAKVRRHIGEHSMRLLRWRHEVEARFRFDAAHAIDPEALETLAARLAQRRKDLASVLSAGAAELQKIVAQYEAQRRALLQHVEAAARALAQAQADLAMVT